MSVLATMRVNVHDFEGTSSQAWQTGCLPSAEGATAGRGRSRESYDSLRVLPLEQIKHV